MADLIPYPRNSHNNSRQRQRWAALDRIAGPRIQAERQRWIDGGMVRPGPVFHWHPDRGWRIERRDGQPDLMFPLLDFVPSEPEQLSEPELEDREADWRVAAGLSAGPPPPPENANRPVGASPGAAHAQSAKSFNLRLHENNTGDDPGASAAAEGEDLCASQADAQADNPLASLEPDALADLLFDCDIAKLCRLGERAVREVFVRIGRERLLRTYLETLIREVVARLTREMLAVTGGDQPITPPLFAVPDDWGEDEEP